MVKPDGGEPFIDVGCSSLAVLGMVKRAPTTEYQIPSCSSLAVLGMVKLNRHF